MTETTIHRYTIGDLVHLIGNPGACSHCGDQITAALGAVVEHGIYQTIIVTLVDRSFADIQSTLRVCCGAEELRPADMPDVIHASPEDIAAAINAGWLPPGSEFHGCEFRVVQRRENSPPPTVCCEGCKRLMPAGSYWFCDACMAAAFESF